MRIARKLVRGRSQRSYLLVAGSDVHVFVWSPLTGAESLGTTVRWRSRGGWTHVRLIFGQRNRRGLRRPVRRRAGHCVLRRRSVTVGELAVWRTAPGTSERVGTKGYVRVKAAWPGRQLASVPGVASAPLSERAPAPGTT